MCKYVYRDTIVMYFGCCEFNVPDIDFVIEDIRCTYFLHDLQPRRTYTPSTFQIITQSLISALRNLRPIQGPLGPLSYHCITFHKQNAHITKHSRAQQQGYTCTCRQRQRRRHPYICVGVTKHVRHCASLLFLALSDARLWESRSKVVNLHT